MKINAISKSDLSPLLVSSRPLRILNLGAGVQSTTVDLLARGGIIDPIDHEIFADTQEEPQAVYDHLAWLWSLRPGPVMHIGTAGKLGDHLLAGTNGASQREKHKVGLDGTTRCASIPAYTAPHHDGPRSACERGMVRRQCTKEYKIEVVERIIRRVIMGLKPRQRMPKGTQIVQLFGISQDEQKRAVAIQRRFSKIAWATPEFPLIDLRMTRIDCQEWLRGRVPHEVPRSACVFCPYKRATEWLRTKANPAEWSRAVEIDRGLRTEGAVVNRALVHSLYLHRSCIPLEMVDLEAEARKEEAKRGNFDLFAALDCGEGMCGV